MKWLLLVVVIITDPSPNISVEREVEIETEELCEVAKKKLINLIEGFTKAGITGVCIQVRE